MMPCLIFLAFSAPATHWKSRQNHKAALKGVKLGLYSFISKSRLLFLMWISHYIAFIPQKPTLLFTDSQKGLWQAPCRALALLGSADPDMLAREARHGVGRAVWLLGRFSSRSIHRLLAPFLDLILQPGSMQTWPSNVTSTGLKRPLCVMKVYSRVRGLPELLLPPGCNAGGSIGLGC